MGALLTIAEVWLLLAFVIISDVEGTQMPTGPLRLLRLLRMSCMARLLRALLELLPRPKGELLPKAKGIYVGARAVGQSLLMMALFLYALAIVMHMISKKNPCVKDN